MAAYQLYHWQALTDAGEPRQGALAEYNGAAWATDTRKYTVEPHFRSGTDWGSYMWLGGPGAG